MKPTAIKIEKKSLNGTSAIVAKRFGVSMDSLGKPQAKLTEETKKQEPVQPAVKQLQEQSKKHTPQQEAPSEKKFFGVSLANNNDNKSRDVK